MKRRATVTGVEDCGDKIRVRGQATTPGGFECLTFAIEMPVHHARHYWIGRAFEIVVEPKRKAKS